MRKVQFVLPQSDWLNFQIILNFQTYAEDIIETKAILNLDTISSYEQW